MSFDPNYFGEVAVAPLDPRFPESVTICRFDSRDELLWAGTESGFAYTLQVPTLQRYASWRAHPQHQQVLDMAVLGDSMLTASPVALALHGPGGVPYGLIAAPEDDELQCCVAHPNGRSLALAGLASGGLAVYDLATKQLSRQMEMPEGDSVVALAAPLNRGAAAAGTANGRVSLLDPRTAKGVEAGMLAHGGGLTALEGRGDLLATCGLTQRMGQVVVDNNVKVFDVRSVLRPLCVLSSSSPSLLRFHPLQTGCLLVASPSGIVSVADAQAGILTSSFQVPTGGEPLTAMDLSPSGDVLAFCSPSFTHLWSSSASPHVHIPPLPLELPPYAPPKPLLARREDESFAAVQQYMCTDKRLLSDVEPTLPIRVGLPPHVLDGSITALMAQHGFHGHVPNPQYRRGQPFGAATAAVAPLRSTRLQLKTQKQDAAANKAERAKQRAAAGGVVLPDKYRRTEIKVQGGTRFEEFDLTRFNATHFAGLENDLPNCYSNALMQALYFIPAFREVVLSRPPEPALECCLADEMWFLFRMLSSGQGIPCQAANLLRALKQIPEAGALGLLEGAVGWEGWGGQKGEGKREGALARRIASLSRFLLDQISKEASKGKAAAGAGATQHVDAARAVFALQYRQRTQCVHDATAQKLRESHSFQVNIRFPPAPKTASRPSTADSSRTAAANQRPSTPPPTAPTTPPANRPAFSKLLHESLLGENETRAWYDDQRGYQMVRISRVPLSLPQTLVVDTCIQDPADIQWMLPHPLPTPPSSPSDSRGSPPDGAPWFPWVLVVESRPEAWQVEVRQADSLEDVQQAGPPPDGVVRKVYELTGALCHVRDLDDAEGSGDGHIVAHIKVPQAYVTEQHHQTLAASQPHHDEVYHYLPDDLDPSPQPKRPTSPSIPSAPAPPSAPFQDHILPDSIDDPPGLTHPRGSDADQLLSAAGVSAGGGPPGGLMRQESSGQLQSEASSGVGQVPGGRWMVFNDFTIQPCFPEEVLRLYGGQKLPCLLYYSEAASATDQEKPLPPPVPVMTPKAFHALCSSPPLQGRTPQRPPFTPLDPKAETPRQGMLLAIDAEFVALSPPETVLGDHGEDIQLKQSLLSLARVSVLRGEGSKAGVPCIDDYVHAVEPVFDHLTRFSGLEPGDLDPSASSKHLVTLKAAYMKLRYLVDAGCRFVGHGLKKDFRIINIVVPPHQILDTVEIWNLPRQRKLSLRFLASYLLGLGIQQATHDSIEDAHTALQLYTLHLRLQEEGRFKEKLLEVYQWGKMYGWEPVVHVDGKPQPPASSM